jgi:glutamine synthetase
MLHHCSMSAHNINSNITTHTAEQTVAALRAQGVHTVLAQFTDIHGIAKGKLVPLEHWQSLVNTGAGFAGPSIWGTGLPRYGKKSEYYGKVIQGTERILLTMPGVVHAVCDGYAGKEPLATCSRQMLKRVLTQLDARGWTLNVGIEPEFFLLKRDAQNKWQVADEHDNLDKPSYDLKSIHRNYAFLDEMRSTLQALQFKLTQIDHEDAPGQYEVNYEYADALNAADDYMRFKMAAHAVAQKHGMTFSCMPKPLPHAPGSGLHFHLSITDKNGKAIFSNAKDALGLSPEGYQFTAGLLKHADALAALCAPTTNSYKRLAVSKSASGSTWSPVWKSYGDNNRTTLVRTVDGRLEWRMPDPACNVYAAIAGVCAAGLMGIDKNYAVPAAFNEDLYELTEAERDKLGMQRLPASLSAALDALQSDAALREAVGAEFCEQYLKVKRLDCTDPLSGDAHWELQRYADMF